VSTAPRPRKKHRTLGAADSTVRMARKLRREMSLPEILLWRQLQEHPGGYLFRKQHPIGTYSLDFACIRARLAIEVDGEAHERGDRPARDEVRDAWVLKQGVHTLRIPAVEVLKNMEGVIIAIVEACRVRAKPNPPWNGEVARRSRDGGVGRSAPQGSKVTPARPVPSTTPQEERGPPPRSGEELR
jgi:very-short-patch-repair endonuclease